MNLRSIADDDDDDDVDDQGDDDEDDERQLSDFTPNAIAIISHNLCLSNILFKKLQQRPSLIN